MVWFYAMLHLPQRLQVNAILVKALVDSAEEFEFPSICHREDSNTAESDSEGENGSQPPQVQPKASKEKLCTINFTAFPVTKDDFLSLFVLVVFPITLMVLRMQEVLGALDNENGGGMLPAVGYGEGDVEDAKKRVYEAGVRGKLGETSLSKAESEKNLKMSGDSEELPPITISGEVQVSYCPGYFRDCIAPVLEEASWHYMHEQLVFKREDLKKEDKESGADSGSVEASSEPEELVLDIVETLATAWGLTDEPEVVEVLDKLEGLALDSDQSSLDLPVDPHAQSEVLTYDSALKSFLLGLALWLQTQPVLRLRNYQKELKYTLQVAQTLLKYPSIPMGIESGTVTKPAQSQRQSQLLLLPPQIPAAIQNLDSANLICTYLLLEIGRSFDNIGANKRQMYFWSRLNIARDRVRKIVVQRLWGEVGAELREAVESKPKGEISLSPANSDWTWLDELSLWFPLLKGELKSLCETEMEREVEMQQEKEMKREKEI